MQKIMGRIRIGLIVSILCLAFSTAAYAQEPEEATIEQETEVAVTDTEDGQEAQEEQKEIEPQTVEEPVETALQTEDTSKAKWIAEGDNWYYMQADGKLAKNQTLDIDNQTYTFNGNGLMIRGWFQYENMWFYYRYDGGMVKSNWAYVNGIWYYFNENGVMASNQTLDIGGATYSFRGSGAMITGWFQYETTWYYYTGSGAMMKKNWLNQGGVWYYLKDNGVMAANQTLDIGGATYTFNGSGRMVTGWFQYGESWFYYNSSGAMVKNSWAYVHGAWYYLYENGVMAKSEYIQLSDGQYFLQSSGAMFTGWLNHEGKTYYYNGSGRKVFGWSLINGNWHYFDQTTGRMFVNEKTPDGYDVNADGIWLKDAQRAVQEVVDQLISQAGWNLHSCYQWILDNCSYRTMFGTPYGNDEYTWEQWHAINMWETRSGNCYSYAALFGQVAKRLGYSDTQIRSGMLNVWGSGWHVHGWVVINGQIYDPQLNDSYGVDCFGTSPGSYM